jgi:hypothetical protein
LRRPVWIESDIEVSVRGGRAEVVGQRWSGRGGRAEVVGRGGRAA